MLGWVLLPYSCSRCSVCLQRFDEQSAKAQREALPCCPRLSAAEIRALVTDMQMSVFYPAPAAGDAAGSLQAGCVASSWGGSCVPALPWLLVLSGCPLPALQRR